MKLYYNLRIQHVSGRVLLEIGTQPGGKKIEKPREDLDVNEIKRIEPFQVSDDFFHSINPPPYRHLTVLNITTKNKIKK